MELREAWRLAVRLARDPAVIAAGLLGGIWTALVILFGSVWAPNWFGMLPLAPAPLAGTVLGGMIIHGMAFYRARQTGWWALPVSVMVADGLTGLLGGGLVAGYALVLTPALMGFPGLHRFVLDLAPPYSTVLITTVTLWALTGMGALAGGVTGMAGAVVAFPAQLVVWGMLTGISGRRIRAEAAARVRDGAPWLDAGQRAA